MNYKSLYYIPLLSIAVMSSCSSDYETNSSKSEYINSVRVTVEDFLPENPSTRTSYTVNESGFHFQWADGDALGIYPIGGDQVKFPISNGDGSASATFDGGAWKLRSEYQYAAYYPFSVDNYKIDQTALPVSFTGQTQNGDNSTAHLGSYDYLACAATTPDASGGVDLTMKHLGAFVRLQLTMPKADTYSSVVLESDGAKFVTAGTFDLTAATPAITPTATSSTYTINLTNVATTDKDQVITVYTIVAPSNLSSSNITVTVHGTGQTTYVQTVPGKNFVARSAYNIAVDNFPSGTNASGEDVSWEEPSNMENGHEYVDLGLPSGLKWATMNVGADAPEKCGLYFMWGEITGYTSVNIQFAWSNYKWFKGWFEDWDDSKHTMFSKYVGKSSYGNIRDDKFVLESEDDAAFANWGGSWRMPTETEVVELCENCTCTQTILNGINGYILTSKTNQKSIFLPTTGVFDVNYKVSYEDDVYCWTSSLCTRYIDSESAGVIHLQDDYRTFDTYAVKERRFGLAVRPVCP